MTKQQSSHASKTKTARWARLSVLRSFTTLRNTRVGMNRLESRDESQQPVDGGSWPGSHSGHLLSVIPGISSPQPIRAQYVRLSANQKQLRQSSALLRAHLSAPAQKAVRATGSVCVITTRRAHKALTRPFGIFLPGPSSKAECPGRLWPGVTKGFWFKDRALAGAGVLAALLLLTP